ncbi:hypothetical protein [Botrimarina sp.]|uniref:hypothetical protein n=1 Tax=Botrimarina sp. TaxID=2795802 RepID=UPI0032EE71C1
MPDSASQRGGPSAIRKSESPLSIESLPWSVRGTAALAWLVATLALVGGASRWLSPDGRWSDLAFGIALASGAAYLGMALTRQATFAWDACRRIAAATGAINAITMPAFLFAWVGGLALAPPTEAPQYHTHVILLATAVVATATPWAIYLALDGANVRRWIDTSNAG